eukprot:9489352-Pyramimonas_sp.AAC.1
MYGPRASSSTSPAAMDALWAPGSGATRTKCVSGGPGGALPFSGGPGGALPSRALPSRGSCARHSRVYARSSHLIITVFVTDTIEFTTKPLLSHLVTREFDFPNNRAIELTVKPLISHLITREFDFPINFAHLRALDGGGGAHSENDVARGHCGGVEGKRQNQRVRPPRHPIACEAAREAGQCVEVRIYGMSVTMQRVRTWILLRSAVCWCPPRLGQAQRP